MNCFIVVEELEIKVPEPDNYREKQEQEKNPLECKNSFYLIGKRSGSFHGPHLQLSKTISMPISFGTWIRIS